MPFFTLGKHNLTLEDTLSGEHCLQGTTKDGAEVRRFSSILTFPLEWMQLDFSDVGCLAVSCTYRGGFNVLSNSHSFRGWLAAFLPEHCETASTKDLLLGSDLCQVKAELMRSHI